ncbi:MAG: NAD(P)/FAD-dependent oxidoreductase [Alkalispirochaeta sp.]
MAHTYDVTIVGAGIAGLAAARELSRNGFRTVVLDKGRSVGGRMATRRIAGDSFDTGAQFFTAVTPEFSAVVETAAAAGVVTQWYQRPPRRSGGVPLPVWRGSGGMTDLPKWIAADQPEGSAMEIHLSTRVTALEPTGGRVLVWTEDTHQPPIETETVILTPPVPQLLELLPPGIATSIDPETATIDYDPCLALLLTLEDPLPGLLNEHGWFRDPEPHTPIAWVADNAMKGLSPNDSRPARTSDTSSRLTVHSSAATARRLYDDDHRALQELTEALSALVPADQRDYLKHARSQSSLELKKWRYARPTRRAHDASVELTPRIIMAGDAFGGGRVEGAFTSGLHAAKRVLSTGDQL